MESASSHSVFFQQRKWLSYWGFMAETMVMFEGNMVVDGGEVKWLGLTVKAVNREGEQDEDLVLERERG